METVQAFKKLLELDLNTVQLSPDDSRSLHSINQASEKLNNLLENNILKSDSNSLTKQDNLSEINRFSSFNEDMCVNPGIDGNNVKTFEELLNTKLQNQHFLQPRDSKIIRSEKRPFLKKGAGITRYCKNVENVTSPQLESRSNFDKSKKGHMLSERPNVNLNGLKQKEFDKSKENKPKLMSRRVLPISKKSSNQAPRKLKIMKDSQPNLTHQTEEYIGKLDEVLSKLSISTQSDDNFNQKAGYHLKNKLFNNLIPENLETRSLDTNGNPLTEPKSSIYSLQIVKQITKLESRLLELMSLKSTLTQENQENHQNKEDNSISLQLCDILNEISKLNDKLLPILKINTDIAIDDKEGETKSDSSIFLNADSKSRDLCAPKHNSETTISTLSNGDKIKLSKDHSITYEHLNGILQTVHQDGLRVVQFPNGQIERIHKNGTRQIIYSDGQQRIIRPDNSEEIFLIDGRVCTVFADGSEKIEYQNGDVEYKTHDCTKRQFQNGNIKTVYSNGCQETIYSNGRIRLKDKLGNIIFDHTP